MADDCQCGHGAEEHAYPWPHRCDNDDCPCSEYEAVEVEDQEEANR